MTLLVSYAVALIRGHPVRDLRAEVSSSRLARAVKRAPARLLLSYIYCTASRWRYGRRGIYALLFRTRFGRSWPGHDAGRNGGAARGIDVTAVAAITFGVGVAVTAPAG